jgi:hypothetical protein
MKSAKAWLLVEVALMKCRSKPNSSMAHSPIGQNLGGHSYIKQQWLPKLGCDENVWQSKIVLELL